MKYILTLLLLATPTMAQWRPVSVSSNTDKAITENFRRASLWSNRKFDRFSNDPVYGQPTFINGIKFNDGSIQTTAVASTQAFVVRTGDTMSGPLTMSASSITIRYTGNAPLSISQNTTAISDILTNTGLSMIGADNTPTRFGLRTYGVAGSGAYAQRRARGTAASPSAVDNGDQLLSLEGWGYGATGWLSSPNVMVRGWAADTWTDSYAPTYLSLWTTQTLVPAERVRILASGNVGISTTAPVNTLAVQGSILASSSITAQGGFYGDGSALTGVLTAPATFSYLIAPASFTYARSGDNLGSHVATQTLNMAGNTINNVTFIYSDGSVGSNIMSTWVGAFQFFISASSTCPSGWLRADGTSKSTSTYPSLFAVMGYMFGGSGANFTLPDMNNGEFVRAISTSTTSGWARTAQSGIKQEDAIQGHYHSITDPTHQHQQTVYSTGGGQTVTSGRLDGTSASIDSVQYTKLAATGVTVNGASTDSTYGAVKVAIESRPRNYSMIPCIFSGVY